MRVAARRFSCSLKRAMLPVFPPGSCCAISTSRVFCNFAAVHRWIINNRGLALYGMPCMTDAFGGQQHARVSTSNVRPYVFS